jgi:hypothetical protein
MQHAIVKNDIVENIIVLKEGSSWKCPDSDCQVVKVTDDTGEPTIGLGYIDGKFESPERVEGLPNYWNF